MKKVSDKDKTSTYCFMVFAFVMVLVGVYILSCISFYPAFEKECEKDVGSLRLSGGNYKGGVSSS